MGLRSRLLSTKVPGTGVRWTGPPRRLIRNVLALCLFEVGFYLAYRYGMAFSQATSSPFWFPDSILLCALLLSPSRYWSLLIVAALPIRLFSPESAELPLWFLLATFAIDSAKGVLAAVLLKRVLGNPLRFETVGDFARYTGIAVLLVPALGASGGAAVRHLLGHEFGPSWMEWFAGNALAQLVVTPAILYWVIGAPWRRPWPPVGRRWEALIIAVGLVVTTWLAFSGGSSASDFTHSRYYAPLPFLVWAAVRFGMRGATGGIAIVTFIAVGAALTGQASFDGKSPAETAFVLQKFLFARAAPLYLVAVLFDQMTRTERFLRDSEQRYREVVDAQTDLVCRFLPDTTLTFVNAAYCRHFDMTKEQLIGRTFLELLPEEARPMALEQVKLTAAQRKPNVYEHEVILPGGERGWHQWTDHPIFDAAGQLKEFQSIGHDITDRKRAEKAIQNLTHAARLAAVGQLTAVIAHEVTQPLSAMLSNAQTAARYLRLRKPVPVTEISEIIDDICNDSLRAAEAISRIRNLSRNEGIHLQPLDVNECLQDVLRLAAGDAARRGVRIVWELDQSIPNVRGDRVHLQQVVLNLVFNAMDAMSECPKANRQLTIGTRARESGGHAHVEVAISDCGPGIPPQRLAQIFRSFFTTKVNGMGMGLAIARSIIEAHGGRIWAKSAPGEGATFCFLLRVEDAKASRPPYDSSGDEAADLAAPHLHES